MNEQDARLLDILRECSVKFGDFTLASGQKSDYYIDVRLTSLNAEGATLIGEAVWRAVQADHPDCIGGLTLGADPIATAASIASFRAGHPVPAYIVRKEAKSHGTGKPIEGPFPAEGARAVVVEDVCSTGGSAVQAIEAVRAAFGSVVRVVAVVDRDMGAAQRFADLGVPYTALFTKDELLAGR